MAAEKFYLLVPVEIFIVLLLKENFIIRYRAMNM